jgi:hypothetical protein
MVGNAGATMICLSATITSIMPAMRAHGGR